MKVRNRIMFVLSLLGLAVGSYVLQSFLRHSAIVCLNSGCELVRNHPSSYLFGIPVPAFGVLGYSGIATLCFLKTIQNKQLYDVLLMIIASGGVLFVGWFTYTEITVIHAICSWCA